MGCSLWVCIAQGCRLMSDQLLDLATHLLSISPALHDHLIAAIHCTSGLARNPLGVFYTVNECIIIVLQEINTSSREHSFSQLNTLCMKSINLRAYRPGPTALISLALCNVRRSPLSSFLRVLNSCCYCYGWWWWWYTTCAQPYLCTPHAPQQHTCSISMMPKYNTTSRGPSGPPSSVCACSIHRPPLLCVVCRGVYCNPLPNTTQLPHHHTPATTYIGEPPAIKSSLCARPPSPPASTPSPAGPPAGAPEGPSTGTATAAMLTPSCTVV